MPSNETKEELKDFITEEIIPEEVIKSEPKPIEKVLSQEEIKLNRSRVIMKSNYPKIKFIESIEAIKHFRDSPRCNTCKHYYEQSKISDIKAKIRRDKGTDLTFFMLRLYKNSAEKLEDAKGYCCSTLTTSGDRQAKCIISVPTMSLCSNYTLQPDINAYFKLLTFKLDEIERLERKAIKVKTNDLIKREEAKKLIASIDKKYKQN